MSCDGWCQSAEVNFPKLETPSNPSENHLPSFKNETLKINQKIIKKTSETKNILFDVSDILSSHVLFQIHVVQNQLL